MPVVDMVKTGQNISLMRKKAGLSIADLQHILGLTSPRAVFKWQRGDCLPSIDNLVVLAHLFNVSIDDIIVVRI